jgi:hypothetical protein
VAGKRAIFLWICETTALMSSAIGALITDPHTWFGRLFIFGTIGAAIGICSLLWQRKTSPQEKLYL